MCDVACGESIARAILQSEQLGSLGTETLDGLPIRQVWFAMLGRQARECVIETPGRRVGGEKSLLDQSVREEIGRNLDRHFSRQAREGRNPGEHPAGRCANHTATARDSPEGSKPRNRGFPGPASLLRREGISGKTNGMWVRLCGNTGDTFGEEKAPKGEAQERRRCETKPARARREETVMRVNKP